MYRGTFAWPAQVYQESLCDPTAISHAGARGFAQIMPATFAELRGKMFLPIGTDPYGLIAIDMGAFYQAERVAGWTWKRPPVEQYWLGAASYNAGFGNILKAQKLSGEKRYWRDISPWLPAVTGQNAEETVTYVLRIDRWWSEMCGVKPFCKPEDM